MSQRTWNRFVHWLDNSALNHSARNAVAAMASLVVARLFALPEAFWAAITTLIVMQSALGTSLPVAGRQFTGAVLGAVVGPLFVNCGEPRVLMLGAGILLLGLLCDVLGRIHTRVRNHLDATTYRYACVTLAIILLVPRTQSPWIVAASRFLEVSIGIAVALIITVIWPEQ